MRFLPIKQIVVHHSTGGSWSDIKAWHRTKGYGTNSAYNFFITEDAQLKTGRPINQPSSATQSWIANHNGIHVCVAGNFQTEKPTQEQLNLLARIAHARNLPLVGHRDINATACPGRNLYKLLKSLNMNFFEEVVVTCQELWPNQSDEDKKKVAALARKARIAQEGCGLPVSK